MRTRWIFAFLIAVFLAPSALAQTPAWTLTNASNQTLSFETLDPSRGTWKGQQLFPNQSQTYNIVSGQRSSKIRIATQGRGHVEYTLNAGGNYRIVWDGAKNVWDVRTATAAAAPNPAAAQGASLPSWQLHNSSNEKLEFETFDPARGTWKLQTIFPNQTTRYTLSAGNAAGKIRVATKGRGHVQYDVRAGQNYQMAWDAAKGVWDLKTLRGS